MKILIIKCPGLLSEQLRHRLKQRNFAVDLVDEGQSGLRFARAMNYDVIIVGLMGGLSSGLSLLQRLCRASRHTSIMVISASDCPEDRIRCLESGADDFLLIPFDFDEFIARIKALMRRRYGHRNPNISLGNIVLNTALQTVMYKDELLPLTPHEVALLQYLALHRGQVISVQNLLNQLYDSDSLITPNTIEAHISALRRKLNPVGAGDLIKTRRGFGYFILPEK